MLPRLQIPLIAPGFRFLTKAQWLLVSITGVSLLATGWIGWHSHNLKKDILHHQEAVTRLQDLNQQYVQQANRDGIDLSPSRTQPLLKEIAFSNQLYKHQSFSWTTFLTDLESTVPKGISIESIELSYQDTSIGITGSAISLSEMNALVGGLENHPRFHNVEIARHVTKTMTEQDNRQIFAFALAVHYQAT